MILYENAASVAGISIVNLKICASNVSDDRRDNSRVLLWKLYFSGNVFFSHLIPSSVASAIQTVHQKILVAALRTDIVKV